MAEKPNKTEQGRQKRAAEKAARAAATQGRRDSAAAAQGRSEQRKGRNADEGSANRDASFAAREANAGLTLDGNKTTSSGRGGSGPSFADREAANGLTNTTSGRVASKATNPDFPPVGTPAGNDEFTATNNVGGGGGGGGGPDIWDIDLGSDLNLDPFTLASKVLDSTINSFLGAAPGAGDFASIFTNAASSLTRITPNAPSIVSQLVALFTPLEGVIQNLISEIDTLLNDSAGISSSIESHFSALELAPKDGDYIYNTEFGICYVIFKTTSGGPGQASPSSNLLFRVAFSATSPESEEAVDYVAMLLVPSPDIQALINSLFGYIIGFLQKTVSGMGQGALDGIFAGAVSGLNALFEEILLLIQALEQLLIAISNALALLSNEVAALTALVTIIEAQIVDLETRVALIETQLAAATDISVIMADGTYGTVSTLSYTPGGTARREITWVDSETGGGLRASFIIADGEAAPVGNIQAIDYRKIDYIHPTGVTYTMYALVRITGTEAGPVDSADFPNYGIKDIDIVNTSNVAEQKQALMLPDGSLPPS